MPTVSVVIPTYNQSRYLGQAIRSVQAQSYADWEVIVVDDGSTDDTAAVVSAFSDSRIRYLRQENQERSRARNLGIQGAQGALIAFLDADDFWLPAYLEKQVANLRQHPEIGMSCAGLHDVDPDGRIIRTRVYDESLSQSHQAFLAAMLIGNRIPLPGVVVMRAETLETAGRFDPDLRYGEDWDLWLRVALRFPVGFVAEPLACYRHYHTLMPARYSQRGVEQAYARIIQKAFEQLGDSPLRTLKPQALGRAHWYCAWIRYVLGDAAEGQRLMTRAHEVHPAMFAAPYTAFVESVAYLADEMYDLYTPLDEALACIERLFDNLPDWAQHLRRLRRPALGQYCGLHVFRGYEKRDAGETLRAAARAIAFRPGWLANRGFDSIVARTLLSLKPSGRTTLPESG